MLVRWLRTFTRGVPAASAAMPDPTPQRPSIELHWRDDARWPIPDWEQTVAGNADLAGDAHDAWTAAAHGWLERLADEWTDDYTVRESREFLLLSALPEREAQVFLRFCESVRGRILSFLDGLASPAGRGKHAVVVMDDQDDYYDYISSYHTDGGEYALSSGVFVNAGYGHFVLWRGDLDAMEPTVAHELTHSLVAHLPLPLWLNEGIAVNSERRIFPQLAHPNAQPYFPHEMQAKHAAFWNAETIQQFWSGEAFSRPDEGSMLAYDLATKITALAARDFDAFRRFATKAHWQDAGLAAQSELEYGIEDLVQAVLGPGDWQPIPVGDVPEPCEERTG